MPWNREALPSTIKCYEDALSDKLRKPVAHLFGTIPVYANRFLPEDEIRLETARERLIIKLADRK